MKQIVFSVLFFLLFSILRAQSDTSMVLIPGGVFIMGKDMANGLGFSPAHLVKIDSFFMDKHELSNRQYFEFCQATGHKLPEFWNTELFRSGTNFLNYPVVGINSSDAMEYARWAGKRLPTEAEWEYAARGGLEDMNFPNGNEWIRARALQDSTGWKNLIDPVGSYEPNAFGLYNMSGNVWEWVSDRYSETYYSERVYDNPKGPEQGSNRVIRGGSWHSGEMCHKVFYRKGLCANWCDYAVGFRCIKEL